MLGSQHLLIQIEERVNCGNKSEDISKQMAGEKRGGNRERERALQI